MAIQSRTFLYIVSRLKDGAVDIATKAVKAPSRDKAIEFGRKTFFGRGAQPPDGTVWSDSAYEFYRS